MTDAENAPQSLPPELLDQLATEFEQSWRQGVQARIEDFLDKVEKASRPSLFRELLKVELELRQAGVYQALSTMRGTEKTGQY